MKYDIIMIFVDLTADAIPVSSSMATKDQRMVIANQEKKGFSSQARRFTTQVCLVGTHSTSLETVSQQNNAI